MILSGLFSMFVKNIFKESDKISILKYNSLPQAYTYIAIWY